MSLLRRVHLLAFVVPVLAALALVGAEPATATEHVVYRPHGVKEVELIADNVKGIIEKEITFTEPAGYYEMTSEMAPGGDGLLETRDGVIIQDTEGHPPSGFVKLEHLGIESDFEGYETLDFYRYAWAPEPLLLGEGDEAEPDRHYCLKGGPVNCATGNQVVTQTDLSVGGRGPSLALTRTYNSLLAVRQTVAGVFGFGWTGSYSAHLELTEAGTKATVYADNGSSVTFARSGEAWTASSALDEATLAAEGSGYAYTLPDQTVLHFNSAGRLTSEVDRKGNALTMNRNSEGRLESVSDAAKREITFKYDSEGQIESATDPMGHTVKYAYEAGNLISGTQPGEAALRWQFKYNSAHELTSETNGRGHEMVTEYNENGQVAAQTDAMTNQRTWEYNGTETGLETKIVEPNHSVTLEQFTIAGQPTSITRAYATPLASTTSYVYNSSNELEAETNPDSHTTEYGYDSAGNLTSEKNADGDEAKWKYDSKHDIETETTPGGETTTIKRNSAGAPEVIERPAPGSTTQKTTYKYDSYGDVESMTDPLEHTCKYGYDSYGDRTSQTDPEGNKRTWEYNEDSQEIATVSPRGNAAGAEASKFTTKIDRNAQGRPLKITDPLGHTTKYTYDGDGDIETVTDGNSHKTTYTYNNDDEQTKIKEANGSYGNRI